MADKLMRAQVTFPRINGVPADAITNTWYFDGDDGFANDADYHGGVLDALQTFYSSIDQYFSQAITNEATLKIYDMRDPEPRVPEFVDTINLTLGSDQWLPAEVAVCLSFQAAATSGVSQRRRRGRIYLGPINQAVVTAVAGDLRPSSTPLGVITAAAENLMVTDVVGEGSIRWAVYSPTTDLTSSVDDAFNDVASGWADNAFDIQRRRGASSTYRATFPA
jgi:hypothetical protein